MKLFDAHCHLQDPRVYQLAPQLIQSSIHSGVLRFAVNGVSEKDWHLVKKMGQDYPDSVLPCFGLHPWYVADRTPNWFNTLKDFLLSTPNATLGEVHFVKAFLMIPSTAAYHFIFQTGLDKGSHGRQIDFNEQVQVFRQQLELAKELQKPVSIHCVRAFGDLLEIMQSVGCLPGGAILHSYQGSAEMVTPLAKLGAYFSVSGYTMSMKSSKAKKMLKSVPTERILLESDSPDALPTGYDDSLLWVPGDESKALNHPINIHKVLSYTASMLEVSEAELAEITYRNAERLFSCQGSDIKEEG